jgi:hypothetical protein
MTGATSHVQIHLPAAVPGARELSRADADALLAAGGYRLRVQATGAGYRLVGPGAGRGLPLPRPLTGAALYRALVRLGRTRQVHDPGWLHDVAAQLTAGADAPRRLARGLAQEVLLRRLRFNTMVENDPVLRLYCATRPVRATLGDPRAGLTGLVRAVSHHPPHPAHPGGTLPAGLGALIADRGALLRLVIRNRPEHRLDPLRYFLDRFVRPPVKVFRTVLDRYGLSLLDDFAFELSPEFTATGRIVVRDFACLPDDPDQREARARAGLLTVHRAVETLTEAFRGNPATGAGRFGAGSLGAAVEHVIAEELRFLRPETAALLGRDHPLGHLVHAVPATQEETLRAILRRVEDGARRRRADPAAPRPAVMIDLDLCGLVPLERTLRAAGQVAVPRRAGRDRRAVPAGPARSAAGVPGAGLAELRRPQRPRNPVSGRGLAGAAHGVRAGVPPPVGAPTHRHADARAGPVRLGCPRRWRRGGLQHRAARAAARVHRGGAGPRRDPRAEAAHDAGRPDASGARAQG